MIPARRMNGAVDRGPTRLRVDVEAVSVGNGGRGPLRRRVDIEAIAIRHRERGGGGGHFRVQRIARRGGCGRIRRFTDKTVLTRTRQRCLTDTDRLTLRRC